MARPWIGIPARFHDDGRMARKVRQYVEPVLWAGGVPVMIPTFATPAEALEYAERLDGILLPGSPTDIDPSRYGEQPHERLGKLFPEREALDFALLEFGERAGLPALGICFGVQSLNVFRGGKLIQDIPSIVSRAAFHDDHGDPPVPALHDVRLQTGSRLRSLAGADSATVNSFHHQAVQSPGRNLRVTAFAPDGLIEAVEDTRDRFVVGVQWHPERDFRMDSFSQALFREFILEAERFQSRRHSV